jgi:hypothetical protein
VRSNRTALYLWLPVTSGRGEKLGTHGIKVDGVSLLLTVFDMSDLPESEPADAKEGLVGATPVNQDSRSVAARTKLRLLCYDPKNNATGSLILGAKVLLQGLRQLAGLEHRADALMNMLTTPAGRFHAALSLAPLLCLYWPKILLDTTASKVW